MMKIWMILEDLAMLLMIWKWKKKSLKACRKLDQMVNKKRESLRFKKNKSLEELNLLDKEKIKTKNQLHSTILTF